MSNIDHSRLLPVAMGERVRDEFSNHIRLEVVQPDVSRATPKCIRLRDAGETSEDIIDQENEGPSPRVLSSQQYRALAAGARRRRDDGAPIRNQARQRSLATVEQHSRSPDNPTIEQLA